jgi:hypothetical protein
MKNLSSVAIQGTASSLIAIAIALSAIPIQAQTISEEVANGAKNGCIRAAESKGFQVKEVVSVEPMGTNGAKAVLSLLRNGEIFKLTCGYTHPANTIPAKEQAANPVGAANSVGEANPTGTNPAGSTNPADTANSAGSTNPVDTANPTGAANSTEGSNSASVSQSGNATNPADTANPTGAANSTEGSNSASVSQSQSSNATNPAAAGNPTGSSAGADAARTAVTAETMGTNPVAKTNATQTDPGKLEMAKPETMKLDGSTANQTVASQTAVAPTDLSRLWWLLLPLLGLPLLLWFMRGRQDKTIYGERSDAIVHGDGNTVEIYANPGTHHPHIGTLYDGQRVTLSGRCHEKWSELADGGWIPSQYLEPLLDNASRYVTR